MPDTGEILLSELRVGSAVHGKLRGIFDLLRCMGCTVTWYDKHHQFLQVTYYNVVIKGPEMPLRGFLTWFESVGIEY